MSSYTPTSNASPLYLPPLGPLPSVSVFGISIRQTWLVLAASVFLVSVPVFFQAPLVRSFPWLSLGLTLAWMGLSAWLQRRPGSQLWGDLLAGFTWTWLAGAVYWGWFRWEPLLHLPIEALGLPFVLYLLWRRRCSVGDWFYLGSLLGTAVTDLYFYLVNLIPHWRQLMQVELSLARPIFQNAVAQMQTDWGIGCAVVLLSLLLLVGFLPLRSVKLHYWAFGGAVLSTILVDGLFWLAATVV